MGWFRGTPAEPFECPRGWGEVSFIRKIVLVPPIFVVERRCPIGGVTDCNKCRYQINPASTELLRMQLEELDRLRGSMLSEAEFRIRRRLIIEAKDPHNPPGQGMAIAALVLGPLGVAAIGVGGYLSAAVSLGFLGLLGGGLVLSGLSAGFMGISRMQRRALPGPDDQLFEEIHEDTYQLEARLERAQEELGFFRELHGPESSEELKSPETKESEMEASDDRG